MLAGDLAEAIRSVESGHRLPKPELAKAADGFFGYAKIFEMMEERLRDLPFPASYPAVRPAEYVRTFAALATFAQVTTLQW